MSEISLTEKVSSSLHSRKALKIDRKLLFEKLSVANLPFDYECTDGTSVRLKPVNLIPKLDNPGFQVSLSGEWRAKKWPFSNEEVLLTEQQINDSSWDTVQQPGKVHYLDPEKDSSLADNWDRVTLAHIHEDDGAILRREVDIPSEWENMRIYICFDAIYPAGKVFCNGVLLGEHMSGLTPAQWDITNYVSPGKSASITVRLFRKHKYVQMDMPRHACEFTGLAQDAYLFATEQVEVYSYHLISDLDSRCKTGSLSGNIIIRNNCIDNVSCSLEVSLFDANGYKCAGSSMITVVDSEDNAIVPVEISVGNVRPWNDEYPNLYRVEIELRSNLTQPQKHSYQTGFRRFELIDQQPRLNGNPVKLRGVDHLTFHPEYGMYTPKEWLRECLQLMKKANVNAIRTHFMGPCVLSELCDEMGFYLIQELPIDWGHDYVHDPMCVGPALFRIEAGIKRDRHHPSILIWCIGNENLPRNMDEHADFFNHLRIFDCHAQMLDKTRPTMFPPPGPANSIKGVFETRVGKIADIHYSFKIIRQMHETGMINNFKTWEADVETYTRKQALEGGWSGVWFSSEYCLFNAMPDILNAPYNSLVADAPEEWNSEKNTMQVFIDRVGAEWGLMRDDPSCLGGALFPWLCAGSGKTWGWTRWAEDADWGVVTSDLLPKPEFWALRVLYSPVILPKKIFWKKGQQTLKFKVRNFFNSIDLKDCKFRVMMGGGLPFITFMRHWKDIKVQCGPGQTETVEVPIWNSSSKEALSKKSPIICRCILLDPNGYRPLTHDILVIPEELEVLSDTMPIGPDAILK